jgi:hypothetical protein
MNSAKFFAGLGSRDSEVLHVPISEAGDDPLACDYHFARPTKVEKDDH